jgi:aminopeptidase O
MALEEISDLRGHIRYQTLKGELECTDEELQTLRPMGEPRSNHSQSFVKNGINPELSCTQVHYLKGHFLLKHLSEMVSKEKFFELLRKYIHEYHGRLVSSTEFLALFFSEFNGISCPTANTNLQAVCDNWLDSKDLPSELLSQYEPSNRMKNILMDDLLVATHLWKEVDKNFKRRKRKKLISNSLDIKSVILVPDSVKSLVTEQLVLLLENLLQLNHLSHLTLNYMDKEYHFVHQSPDVQHRFSELIVKHSCVDKLGFVKTFLYNHQSMGIYLYGEMAISKNKCIKRQARRIFSDLQAEMDPIMKINVKEMLYGSTL